MNSPFRIQEEIALGLTRNWHLNEIVFEATTPYQKMIIGRGAQGMSLFCNQERQSTELSQQIYHEGQFFPAALMAKKIERVLIIGSSEGVVTELARKSGATDVVHVDIDEDCVRACAKYLPYGYNETDIENHLHGKGGATLVFQDGFTYVREALEQGKKFDVIVMDLPDEQTCDESAQQNRLYDEPFLQDLSKLLTPEGAFITQAGCSTFWRNDSLKKAWKRMSRTFKSCTYFEMEEHDWSWIVGANFECKSSTERMKSRLKELQIKPSFIDEISIDKATILPISIRKSQ